MLGKTETLTILLKGKDKFSRVFDKASGKLGGFSGILGKVGKAAGVATAAIGAMAVGIGVKSVLAAAKFEKSMANVATLVDTSTESMADMKKEILDMSGRVPVSIEDLTDALYQVRSAGIDAADAMDVLETSGKLAVAGLATTEEATNLLTSAINVYGDETHDANTIAEILFKTVKYGKTTVAGLAQGFGKVAGIAKETGISIEELSAATAVLTTTGITASEAQTSLKAMISNVLKPTADATKAAEKLGIEFNLGALQAKGLSEMLVEIAEKAGDDKQALADLYGSVDAANSVFTLTSDEGGTKLRDTLNDISIASGALDEAFQKQKDTFEMQWLLVKNKLNKAFIELGIKLMPSIKDAVDRYVLPALNSVSNWVENNGDKISAPFERISDIMKGFQMFYSKDEETSKLMRDKLKEEKFIGPVLKTVDFFGGVKERWNKLRTAPGEAWSDYWGKFKEDIGGSMSSMVAGARENRGQQSFGSNPTYNFDFKGAFIGNPDEFKGQVIDLINRESELGSIGGE